MRYKSILSIKFFLVALLSVLVSCQLSENGTQRNPTAPRISAFDQANFWALEGISDDFGVYKGDEYFLFQIPTGDYLLTYTTHVGTFFIVFRAQRSAQIMVGMNAGDNVLEAMLYTGTVLDASNPVADGPVIRFSESGASGSWSHLFVPDASPAIPIIGGVGAKYIPGELFELYLTLAGNYVLTYKTTIGTFEYEFQAPEDNHIEGIGLLPGVEVLEAYILKK